MPRDPIKKRKTPDSTPATPKGFALPKPIENFRSDYKAAKSEIGTAVGKVKSGYRKVKDFMNSK